MQAPQGAAQVGPQAGAQAAAGAAQAGAQAAGAGAQHCTGAQQLLLRLKHPPSLPQRFRMLLHHPEILLQRLTLQHLTGAQQSTGAGAHAAGAAQAGAHAAAGAAQAGAQAGAQAAAGAAQAGAHAGAQALPQGAAQVGPHAFAQGAAHGAAQLGAASQQVGAGAQHPPRPNRPASAILTLEAISRAAAKVVHFILKSPRHRPGVFGLRIPTTRTYCPGFEGLHHSP